MKHNTPKVTWRREYPSNTAVPYMYEMIGKNINTETNEPVDLWGWRRYTCSNCYVPDKGSGDENFSKGYLSFLRALKLGYTVEKEVKTE